MKSSDCDAKRLGLAGGILWGGVVFLSGLLAMSTGFGKLFVSSVGTIYLGYGPTLMGSFLGLVYGFIDGFVALFLLAWLYNQLGRR